MRFSFLLLVAAALAASTSLADAKPPVGDAAQAAPKLVEPVRNREWAIGNRQ